MRNIFINLALLSGSFLISLVFVEMALRLFVPIPKQGHFETSALYYDELIKAHAFKPSSTSTMTNGYFNEEVVIDQNGYRDFTLNASEPVWGLAVGDSQTFGHGIKVKETWPEQLSQQINKEIYNAGVFGYSLHNYKNVLAKLVPQMKPKVVFIGLTFNDLSNFEQGNMVGVENLQKKTEQGNESFYRLVSGFKLKSIILNSTALGKISKAGLLRLKHSFEDLSLYENELRENIVSGLNFVKEIAADLRRQNIPLVVLYIPNGNLVRDDIYAQNLKSTLKRDVTLSQFKENWVSHDFTFVEPSAQLEAEYIKAGRERAHLILPVDGHNNGTANMILANMLKSQLEKLSLLTSKKIDGE